MEQELFDQIICNECQACTMKDQMQVGQQNISLKVFTTRLLDPV